MNKINVQNAGMRGTIPSDPEPKTEVFEKTAADTVPQDRQSYDEIYTSGSIYGGAAQESDAGANEDFLTIRYNHKDIKLTRVEAATLAQKGIHYEGVYQALDAIASRQGKTAEELVQSLEAVQDDTYRQELMEKFGDEEIVDEMMEHYYSKKQSSYEQAVEKRRLEKMQSTESRLAEQFSELKAQLPDTEIATFNDLPERVKIMAAQGKDLTTAYLLYKAQQERKIAEAAAAQKKAAERSTGSVQSRQADSPSDNAFMRGLWGRANR